MAKEQEYDLEIECTGTRKEVVKALNALARAIDAPEEFDTIVDDNNDEGMPFYDDGIIHCNITPMA